MGGRCPGKVAAQPFDQCSDDRMIGPWQVQWLLDTHPVLYSHAPKPQVSVGYVL